MTTATADLLAKSTDDQLRTAFAGLGVSLVKLADGRTVEVTR